MPHDLRNRLHATANLFRNRSYVISIQQVINLDQENFLFGLRYIPDKLILNNGCLMDYLNQYLLHKPENTTPEILTHTILEDVMDKIIPKWIEVCLKQKDNKFGQEISITAEDRQPNFEDDAILKRLSPLF
ncbi:MAG: hypothetical protein K9G26_09080 [Emcibacter sp.]|nr:hypothetical protein [Emcibacter sp.]